MDKQEKIVCAAVKITYKDGVGDYAVDTICDATYKLIRQSQSYKRQHFVHASTAKDTDGFITNYGRFVDAKEAMRIAVKTGQYPDYEFRKKVCLHEIEEANENKKHNQEHIGFDGQLYVADIGYLENKIKEYNSLLERDYLKPEDLY